MATEHATFSSFWLTRQPGECYSVRFKKMLFCKNHCTMLNLRSVQRPRRLHIILVGSKEFLEFYKFIKVKSRRHLNSAIIRIKVIKITVIHRAKSNKSWFRFVSMWNTKTYKLCNGIASYHIDDKIYSFLHEICPHC